MINAPLNLNFLPQATKALFNLLASRDDMRVTNATLMGGTALTLLIGHRLSEDLDFFYFQESLPSRDLNSLIRSLKLNGHQVTSTLSSAQISQARINGYDIEGFIREYLIDGVKVSFSVMGKGGESRTEHFKDSPKISIPSYAFQILDLNGLFESKAVVLLDRVKSRDLFDIMILIKDHGYTISDVLAAIKLIDDKDDRQANAVLEVLIGNVPLDNDDPGFNSIKLNTDMNRIYQFFNQKVNEYEQSLAKKIIDETNGNK